jgi:hypothetical protein
MEKQPCCFLLHKTNDVLDIPILQHGCTFSLPSTAKVILAGMAPSRRACFLEQRAIEV